MRQLNKSLNILKYYYCGFNEYEETRIKRFRYTQYRGIDAPIANCITTARPPRASTTRGGKRTAQGAGRPRLTWPELVDLGFAVMRHMHACSEYIKNVLSGVSTQDKPPPIANDRMFATSARGQLTGALLRDI
jgi:hypothetical protein